MQCSRCILMVPALLSQEIFSNSVVSMSWILTGADRKTFLLSDAMANHLWVDIESFLSIKTVLPFAILKLLMLLMALAIRSG